VDGAYVHGQARLEGHAVAGGTAWICDNAIVYDYATVAGDTKVCDNARVRGSTRIFTGEVSGDTVLGNTAQREIKPLTEEEKAETARMIG
jgi:carbonic anhydrase/acetyltransferase-like protein (isoleucine patch superfamily)